MYILFYIIKFIALRFLNIYVFISGLPQVRTSREIRKFYQKYLLKYEIFEIIFKILVFGVNKHILKL